MANFDFDPYFNTCFREESETPLPGASDSEQRNPTS